jgi:DNA-binding NtrC family response regulator
VRAQPLFNLLIVEDDQNLAASLRLTMPDSFKVYLAQSPQLIPDHVFFHCALVDLHLQSAPPESDGLMVIQQLTRKNSQTEIVAMSGNLSRELMEKSVTSGAQRFLAKPLSSEEVLAVVEKIEALWHLRLAATTLNGPSARLIGSSSSLQKLRKEIATLKGELTPVLIEGETGTGKDVVARILNQQESARPFITVNCAAISENLFESEFFGHVKGAFTGADQTKIGFAEAAHGGDLFLDEIEALPLGQQAKLLRFLESGEIRKVGAKESQLIQTRMLCASNIPLQELIAEKKFREDLYFRLSAHRIQIPPLRERPEDIAEVAQHFFELQKPKKNKNLSADAVTEMCKYPWPGNVRELKRVCEQLILASPLPVIRDQDVHAILQPLAVSARNTDYDLTQSLDTFLKIQEKKFIEHCLTLTQDLDKSCDILKISKSNLYKKIKDLGIQYG